LAWVAASSYGDDLGRLVVNEFFVPEDGLALADYLARGEKTPVHHLIRYRWAAELLTDHRSSVKSLLDVACGAGYGSHTLATAHPEIEVVGGDYDPEAVAFARRKYVAPNLTFVEADVTRWDSSLGDRSFDCIVSFDTIEHIEHREVMMQNVVNHLDPQGMLLLSTPVKSKNVLNPRWEHHKVEYSKSSLYDFLRRYFREVLIPELVTLPAIHVFDEVNRDSIVYLLKMNPVVCRQPLRIAFGE
jgi:ubiquinone/menaquinone biosynthesis C-methylase UbiE